MNYQALFFDFDGVIADSVEVKTKAFAKLFEEYGPDIQNKVVQHHRDHGGMTRRDKFKYYYKEYLKKDLDARSMEELCSKFSSLVVDNVVKSPEIPCAEKFIKKWSAKTPCFIISATPDKEIIQIVKRRNLDKYFQEILGSFNSKKKNLEYLLDKYNVESIKCLFFGDAESDCRAAKDCAVNFIGIVPGFDAPLLRAFPEIKWFKNFIELDKENT